MKKTLKKAKEKAGRIVDGLRPSSSSRPQSPAPANRDPYVTPTTPLPPKGPEQFAETPSQSGQADVEPVTIQPSVPIVSAPQSMPTDQGPILPPQVLNGHDHDGEAGTGSSDKGGGEPSDVAPLLSSMSLGPHGPVRTNPKLKAGRAEH